MHSTLTVNYAFNFNPYEQHYLVTKAVEGTLLIMLYKRVRPMYYIWSGMQDLTAVMYRGCAHLQPLIA